MQYTANLYLFCPGITNAALVASASLQIMSVLLMLGRWDTSNCAPRCENATVSLRWVITEAAFSFLRSVFLSVTSILFEKGSKRNFAGAVGTRA